MKYRRELRYDAAPRDVHEMLADRAFREQVCVAMGTRSHEVEIDREGTQMSVRVDMVQDTEGIPEAAKKLVGDRTRVLQTERWHSLEAADLLVELPGKPSSLRGTLSLTADGSTTVEVVEGELRVGVPLIGGKLEKMIAGLFDEALAVEAQVGRTWLADGAG